MSTNKTTTLTYMGQEFTKGTAGYKILQYLKKNKKPVTAATIATKTGLNLKTVQNIIAPSGKLGSIKATTVGPYGTFGYSL